jgi:general secretion pathway protein L
MFLHYTIKAYKRYDTTEGHYPKPEEAASATALAVREMDAADTPVVLTIPKQWVVVKTVELPASTYENLREVVYYELDRFTPFAADEALYDFIVIRRDAEKISLLVAAVKEDILRSYSSVLKDAAGITVQRVSFNLSGIATLFRYISGADSFIFLEADSKGLNGGRVENGTLVRAYSWSLDESDDSRKAAAIEEKLMHMSQSHGHHTQMKVLMTFGEGMSGVRDRLRSRGTYASGIIDTMDKKIGGLSDLMKIKASEAGAAMEYLWPDADALNLLRKGVREKAATPFALTVVLALVMAVLLGLYLFLPVQIEEQRLKAIEKQIALRKPEVRKVEELRKEMEALSKEAAFVDTFRSGKPLYLNMLKELTQILPDTAWLTRVRIAAEQVNIEGYAPSANVLIPKLEASKYFRKAEFSSPTFKDARLNMDRFQIKMEIKEVNNEKK